jgi:hypothetical protein
MRDFLKSTFLIRNLTLVLDCPKSYFLKRLGEKIDDDKFKGTGLAINFASGKLPLPATAPPIIILLRSAAR